MVPAVKMGFPFPLKQEYSVSKFRPILMSVGAVVFAVVVVSLLVTGPSTASALSPNAVPVTARYSPLGATANGPSGPATAKFTAGPNCCPSTAVVLTPTAVSTESDFQWMNLGLPWDNTSVSSVQICYAVTTAGSTYISQTRITEMTMPNSATVRLDEGTNRLGPGPSCYTVTGPGVPFVPTGAMTLSLKVVFGSTSDRITVGMVSVSGISE